MPIWLVYILATIGGLLGGAVLGGGAGYLFMSLLFYGNHDKGVGIVYVLGTLFWGVLGAGFGGTTGIMLVLWRHSLDRQKRRGHADGHRGGEGRG